MLFFTSVKAHNPNTTAVVFTPENGVWMINITISQQGANQALANYYQNIDFSKISSKEYKKLYIDYLQRNIDLNIDGKLIKTAAGVIKLGNHQTNVKLTLPDFPVSFQKLSLMFAIFKENKGQNTIVRFKYDNTSIRKILNHKNNFQMQFTK